MRKLAVLAILGMISVACSPGDIADNLLENAIEGQEGVGDVDVDIDSDDGSVQLDIQDEEGDASVTFGGGEIPEDFPWPVHEGGEVQSVATTPQGNSVSLFYDASEFDSLVTLYQGVFASESSGDDSASEFTSTSPRSASFGWRTSDGAERFITITEAGEQVVVNLVYES